METCEGMEEQTAGERAGSGPPRRRLLVVDPDVRAAQGLMSAAIELGYAVFGPLSEPGEVARYAGEGWDAALIADEPGGAWSRPATEALGEAGIPYAMLRAGGEPAGASEVACLPRDVDPAILGGLLSALLASSGPPPERARLCLFDERRLTRDVLAEWLTLAGHEYEVSAHDAPEAGVCAGADVAVIHLAGRDVGAAPVAEGIERLREAAPDLPIAILTDREDEAHLREALALGVRGYVPTSYDREVMLGAIRLLHVGGVFVPAPLLSMSAAPGAMPSPELVPGDAPSALPGLSERQGQVLGLIAEGHPNKIIAHELGLKEATVKMHVRLVMRKLGVTNRTQAAQRLNALALAAQ